MNELARQNIARLLHCAVEEVNEDSALGVTAAWDSLAHVNIMLFLQQRFSIEISETSMREFSRFPEISRLFDNNE